MNIWDGVITQRDKEVYATAGYGKPIGLTNLGKRPAILVIDVTTSFIGDKPEPILESIKHYPNSCGEAGWQATHKIKDLLQVAREKRLPIMYSLSEAPERSNKETAWSFKKTRFSPAEGNTIPDIIKPQPEDIIIRKRKPSVFFGTPLMSLLNFNDVDTVVVTGCTTSGCVRASVIDAFSYAFKVVIVEECVFDRGEISHKVNMFDMHQKYADVAPLGDVLEYLSGLPARNP
ncbi:MAG: isochorismatase family protein [Thaumarchaeota archaeon]|nr:isochorismatase family protein [Nitrososphaerota archaeon]